MGELEDLWDEVSEAVRESLSNGEGHVSTWYLEHHFRKAGLGVYRLPDDPQPTREIIANAMAEIGRLQTAKRAALAMADLRSRENVELRARLARDLDPASPPDGEDRLLNAIHADIQNARPDIPVEHRNVTLMAVAAAIRRAHSVDRQQERPMDHLTRKAEHRLLALDAANTIQNSTGLDDKWKGLVENKIYELIEEGYRRGVEYPPPR